MCGIAAIWNWSEREIPFRQLSAMAKAQMHRGPDGHGYAVWGHNRKLNWPIDWRGPNATLPSIELNSIRLGLAHNLLAIQDTSPAARQPMTVATERYWIVFNGEIYNFIELREELIDEGFNFRSSSDTEVLLTLWQRLGPKALDKMRGMFAFIIYDRDEDVLWAARDRFGIKPLYYALLPGDQGLIFASETRAIHASGLVRRSWDELTVKAFLAAGINKPGEVNTFFDGVNELPPGCLLRIGPGKIAMERYYQLPRAENPTVGSEALPELRSQFLDVVKLHLRSAREVGTCMSGGLDSTNIASAIHQLLGDRVADFKAFTIGSHSNGDYQLAQLASRQIGFQHQTLDSPDVIQPNELVDMVVACETPNHVWGPINQYLLLRYISTHRDLHVVLDGQGGDEVFSGYAWFYPVIESYFRQVFGREEADSFQASHYSKPAYPLSMLKSFHQIFFSRRKWIESFDGGAMASLGCSVDEVMEWAPVNYYLNDELDWPSFREREFYRRELQYLLRQEDRLAMWFSIESRVPFLDHKLVEWVNTLSPRFLMHDGYLKYPLRVLFPELPSEVRFNVVKRGFWENNSTVPYFDALARAALRYSAELRKWVRDERLLNNISQDALWRFFQMAALMEASTKEEGRVWTADLLKKVSRDRRAAHPWFERVGRWGCTRP